VTPLPRFEAPGLDRWIEGVSGRWAADWAEAAGAQVAPLAVLSAEELQRTAAGGTAAFAASWRSGSEEPLEAFAGELVRTGLARHLRVADLAQALDLGRSTLQARIPFSRLSCKAAARELVERTFSRALHHLIESFQRETEARADEARAELVVSREGADRARREWDLLDQILSGMDVGIVLLDRKLDVVWMNRTMPSDLLETSPAEAVGRRCFDVLRANSEECRACAARAVFQGKPAVQHLKQVQTPHGPRDYLKITRPLTLAQEAGPHVVQIFFDITAQQEVQRSLARTQELVRNILDSSVNAIVSTDRRGHITLFNRTAEKMFALAEREVLGTPVALRYVGGRVEAARVMRLLREQGALKDCETAFYDRHGQKVSIRLTASLLRDEEGEVIGTMGFAQDISVEEALRKEVASRDRYLLSILHGSTDGLVTADGQGRVASWNRGASLLFGVGPEEALGRPVDAFLPPGKVRLLPAAADAPPGTERFEFRVEGRAGGHDLLVTRTEIGGDGERGVSFVLKDVTELKRLQQELAEAEHLAELGRLAASIAHEIKNPIAGLRGAMEVMGGVHVEKDPRFAVFREALSQIRRLDFLVKDLLSYARPVTLKTEPVPVTLLVEAAVGLSMDALTAAGVELRNTVPEDLPAVRVDPIQIQQVLVNLIVNAAQATEAGGSVTVSARREPSAMVALAVSDTGCGIAPEVLTNIFKPFFTTKHVGTGLGLSIVQRLLRAHGGWCEVQSEQGKGTTFTVHLPAEGRKN